MRLRLMLIGVLIAACGFGSLGCATTAKILPRYPDGSVNVVDPGGLLNWAEDGIQADCVLGISPAVCTIGTDVISAARAAAAKDPAAGVVAVRQSLTDSVAQWPQIRMYVQWLLDVLNALPAAQP